MGKRNLVLCSQPQERAPVCEITRCKGTGILESPEDLMMLPCVPEGGHKCYRTSYLPCWVLVLVWSCISLLNKSCPSGLECSFFDIRYCLDFLFCKGSQLRDCVSPHETFGIWVFG